MLSFVGAILALYCAIASAFTQRGSQRPYSSLFQRHAFGRLTPPGKSNKMPDAPLPEQSGPSTMQTSVNVGAASLVGIFAVLLVMSQTLVEQGKTQQEQGKMLVEQGKVLTQLDSKFSQTQADVSTFSSAIAAVSTAVAATTYVLRVAENAPEKKGRGDAT